MEQNLNDTVNIDKLTIAFLSDANKIKSEY